MPKQILLHIGTGKTGTTSIQKSLQEAERNGILGEITYPSGYGSNHNFLITSYINPDELPREYRSRYRNLGDEVVRSDASAFREYLFQAIQTHDKLILSGEYFGRLNRETVNALRTDLAAQGVADIRVVAYIRDPVSAYLSVVQQQLKASSMFRSPEAYLYPFQEMLQTWSEVFSDLLVRPFDRNQLIGGDVVSDFDSVASSYFGVDSGLGLPKSTSNESVSAEGMIALQRYRAAFHPDAENEFKWDSSRVVDLLQQSQKSIKQTRATLTSDAARIVHSRHVDGIVWLRERHGVHLATSVPEFSPSALSGANDSGPRYMRDVAEILHSFEPEIVNDVLLFCLQHVLMENQPLAQRLHKLRKKVSELEDELARSRVESAQIKKELHGIQTSRTWRWGRRFGRFIPVRRRSL